ncbi:MAG: hypothetical protein OXI87_05185 [Albidovulum sp.]|nr:hypothetical protein [Albidovulum sp.]MDE0531551.1 hypothetical protein [Albidovulum sp.]
MQSSAYSVLSAAGFVPIPPSRLKARSCTGVADVVFSTVSARLFAGRYEPPEGVTDHGLHTHDHRAERGFDARVAYAESQAVRKISAA